MMGQWEERGAVKIPVILSLRAHEDDADLNGGREYDRNGTSACDIPWSEAPQTWKHGEQVILAQMSPSL